MCEYSVEMKNISKWFPGTQALDKVDLYVKKGEIHALLGENGAGKSTLMNILTGMIPMDTGEILLYGEKAIINNPKDAYKKNIVIVPQELNLIPEATVAENIFLGKEILMGGSLVNWDKTKELAAKALDKLGVNINVEKKVGSLTAAYQQLVSIARALVVDPQILILDEPTAALTNTEADLVFAAMQALKSEGRSIIFITHHLDEVINQADRATILRDGKLVKVCNVCDIDKDGIITAMANREIKKRVKEKRCLSSDVFLEIKNLSRKHEFENVSFQVKKGEIFCVSGLIGSGRTEVFKTVFGITKKDAGDVFVEGEKVDIKHPVDAIKLGIGYVSEERRYDGIIPGMTIMENMMIPSYDKLLKNRLIQYKLARQDTSTWIKNLNIKTPSQDQFIENLSGGNQQKVIIARWMSRGIRLLILDEPTRGIDVNAKGEIHRLIKELADSGVTIIVVSSEMEEVLQLADRIMIMHLGKVKGFLDNSENIVEDTVLKIAFS